MTDKARDQRERADNNTNTMISIGNKLYVHAEPFGCRSRFASGHSGTLMKRGHVVKNWKRRFFVLKNQELKYYTDETLSSLKGEYILSRTSVILEQEGDIDGHHYLLVLQASHNQQHSADAKGSSGSSNGKGQKHHSNDNNASNTSTGATHSQADSLILSAGSELERREWMEAIYTAVHGGFPQVLIPDVWPESFYPSFDLTVQYGIRAGDPQEGTGNEEGECGTKDKKTDEESSLLDINDGNVTYPRLLINEPLVSYHEEAVSPIAKITAATGRKSSGRNSGSHRNTASSSSGRVRVQSANIHTIRSTASNSSSISATGTGGGGGGAAAATGLGTALWDMGASLTDEYCTLLMVDLDFPCRGDSTQRVRLHWLLCNVHFGDFSNAPRVCPYQPPAPCYNSELHRYFFVLFAQPRKFLDSELEGMRQQLASNMDSFKYQDWIKSMKFENPIAINGFYAGWDESCDKLHKLSGFVPPAAYLSPQQEADAEAVVVAALERNRPASTSSVTECISSGATDPSQAGETGETEGSSATASKPPAASPSVPSTRKVAVSKLAMSRRGRAVLKARREETTSTASPSSSFSTPATTPMPTTTALIGVTVNTASSDMTATAAHPGDNAHSTLDDEGAGETGGGSIADTQTADALVVSALGDGVADIGLGSVEPIIAHPVCTVGISIVAEAPGAAAVSGAGTGTTAGRRGSEGSGHTTTADHNLSGHSLTVAEPSPKNGIGSSGIGSSSGSGKSVISADSPVSPFSPASSSASSGADVVSPGTNSLPSGKPPIATRSSSGTDQLGSRATSMSSISSTLSISEIQNHNQQQQQQQQQQGQGQVQLSLARKFSIESLPESLYSEYGSESSVHSTPSSHTHKSILKKPPLITVGGAATPPPASSGASASAALGDSFFLGSDAGTPTNAAKAAAADFAGRERNNTSMNSRLSWDLPHLEQRGSMESMDTSNNTASTPGSNSPTPPSILKRQKSGIKKSVSFVLPEQSLGKHRQTSRSFSLSADSDGDVDGSTLFSAFGYGMGMSMEFDVDAMPDYELPSQSSKATTGGGRRGSGSNGTPQSSPARALGVDSSPPAAAAAENGKGKREHSSPPSALNLTVLSAVTSRGSKGKCKAGLSAAPSGLVDEPEQHSHHHRHHRHDHNGNENGHRDDNHEDDGDNSRGGKARLKSSESLTISVSVADDSSLSSELTASSNSTLFSVREDLSPRSIKGNATAGDTPTRSPSQSVTGGGGGSSGGGRRGVFEAKDIVSKESAKVALTLGEEDVPPPLGIAARSSTGSTVENEQHLLHLDGVDKDDEGVGVGVETLMDRINKANSHLELCEIFGIQSTTVFEGEIVKKKFSQDFTSKDRFVWIVPSTKSIHWAKSASDTASESKYKHFSLDRNSPFRYSSPLKQDPTAPSPLAVAIAQQEAADATKTERSTSGGVGDASPAGRGGSAGAVRRRSSTGLAQGALAGVIKGAELHDLTIKITTEKGEYLSMTLSNKGNAAQRAKDWFKVIQALTQDM